MSNLQNHLEAFADKRLSFTDLVRAVQNLVAGDISSSSGFMTTLSDARDRGVVNDEQLHELLASVIDADNIDVTAAVKTTDHLSTQSFPSTLVTGGQAVVGAGSVIKDRFELEGLIGSGGMGVVYKATDRIKVEAQDREPYVAIKVLNEDFKMHPEAFISLQRECSKAQKLAHPNIATVYDFDRTGGMAFMTMELLQGQPLNEYFATQLPDTGLAFDDAWPIIRGLALALGHAHKNRIVHSDFKPGNAYICDGGEVKVLDFGIARAVKNPGQADTTMFDAGSLGALTPTYASPEMLEGEPPDPRDDIYGLGVVSYILLSSTHPYERHPANLARALELKPKPIAALTKVQNAALAHALEFERERRTPDIDTFLAELEGEGSVEGRLRFQSRLLVVLSVGFAVMCALVIYLLLR